ncbi:MAG: hypothetical protein H3C28_00660 [Sphingomonadales bacterium]|nr:hypothetical protein [Sphingomonadales bacterium]
MASTIFERAGGFSAVRKIVADFYDRLLDDAALQKYFANIDMARLDAQTRELIEADFVAASRGVAELKGFGACEVFTLVSERPSGR